MNDSWTHSRDFADHKGDVYNPGDAEISFSRRERENGASSRRKTDNPFIGVHHLSAARRFRTRVSRDRSPGSTGLFARWEAECVRPDGRCVRVELNQTVNGWKTSNRSRRAVKHSSIASSRGKGKSVGARARGQADRQSGGCKSDKIISNPPVFLPLCGALPRARVPRRYIRYQRGCLLSNVSNVRGWLLLRLLLNETA